MLDLGVWVAVQAVVEERPCSQVLKNDALASSVEFAFFSYVGPKQAHYSLQTLVVEDYGFDSKIKWRERIGRNV